MLGRPEVEQGGGGEGAARGRHRPVAVAVAARIAAALAVPGPHGIAAVVPLVSHVLVRHPGEGPGGEVGVLAVVEAVVEPLPLRPQPWARSPSTPPSPPRRGRSRADPPRSRGRRRRCPAPGCPPRTGRPRRRGDCCPSRGGWGSGW